MRASTITYFQEKVSAKSESLRCTYLVTFAPCNRDTKYTYKTYFTSRITWQDCMAVTVVHFHQDTVTASRFSQRTKSSTVTSYICRASHSESSAFPKIERLPSRSISVFPTDKVLNILPSYRQHSKLIFPLHELESSHKVMPPEQRCMCTHCV